MYSTLGENVGRSNSLEIIQIIDLPGEILPEAGRPRYFREISIVDFFPIRFVHAKDDGTIVSRSKSQREKLVDDRSRVQSNQRFSNMRSKDKYATRFKTVTRVYGNRCPGQCWECVQIRVLDSIILRRLYYKTAIFDSC